MQINMEIEDFPTRDGDDCLILDLPELTQADIDVIDPSVPPTSGIRMEIFEKRDDLYYMSAHAQSLFYRVLKAIGDIGKEEVKKENPSVLIVSDDRPSAPRLMEFCSKIFAYNGYQIYFQKATDERSKANAVNDPYYSRMSTPYASGSIVLCEGMDLIVQLTASHNPIVWNGIKFYIQLPIPISGRVMKAVSKRALELTEVLMANSISPTYIDADGKNNDYVIQLIGKIFDISALEGKKIIFWPYLGHGPEIQDLMKRIGVDLMVIDEEIEPPNPTAVLDKEKIYSIMAENDVKIAILMDADRDRVVFVLRNATTGEFITLSPNELYTAMHNLLAKEFGKKIVNVRTIPSDPRGDNSAMVSIFAGVGYKHLGMVLYAALDQEIDPQKFSSGIFYAQDQGEYRKLTSPEEIKAFITDKCPDGDNLVMVLWEESGGHTFNILDASAGTITSVLPVIGDKYPVPAILTLCALIESGYDLTDSIDKNILGTRTTIDANDAKKLEIVNYFAELKGTTFEAGNYVYKIGNFEQVDNLVDIILFKSETTEIYFRPSGTGPEVRIYVFGPASTAQDELETVAAKINEMFP